MIFSNKYKLLKLYSHVFYQKFFHIFTLFAFILDLKIIPLIKLLIYYLSLKLFDLFSCSLIFNVELFQLVKSIVCQLALLLQFELHIT